MRRIQSRRRNSNRRRNIGSRTGSGSDRRRRNRNRSRRSRSHRSRSHGHGSVTKGWKNASPNRKWKRREMYAKYGKKCFLSPKDLKYPICDRNGRIDKRGVHAAYQRSRQYHHSGIAKKASRLLSRY